MNSNSPLTSVEENSLLPFHPFVKPMNTPRILKIELKYINFTYRIAIQLGNSTTYHAIQNRDKNICVFSYNFIRINA
jgi:hypothetical protein